MLAGPSFRNVFLSKPIVLHLVCIAAIAGRSATAAVHGREELLMAEGTHERACPVRLIAMI